jgi:hypothetical protein
MASHNPVLRLNVFPADHGDALWIEFGAANDVHHVLVDAGTDGTGKRLIQYIQENYGGRCHFDLLVVTHVDADHIAGVLRLLQSPEVQLTFGDIWFNGYVHLKPETMDVFGGVQGERLTTILRDPQRALPWNRHFARKAVRLNVDNSPKQAKLSADAEVHVISADQAHLIQLEPVWKAVCIEAGLVPSAEPPPQIEEGFEAFGVLDIPALAQSEFEEDKAVANGSSIGLVFQFAGKRLVLLGDGLPSVIIKGLNYLSPGKFTADVVKLPHHGSRSNTSPELVQKFDSKNWVFSTSGAIYKHPDREAIARVVFSSRDSRLWFNYRSKQTEEWDNDKLQAKYRYSVRYGDGVRPLKIELI